jgi:membrane glycosyltransferase
MQCSVKTMLKTALVLVAGLVSAYVAFPQARELVIASAPILIALICPISIIAMMFMMRGSGGQQTSCATGEQPQPQPQPQLKAETARSTSQI